MSYLKTQLHIHTGQDPERDVYQSETEIIDRAYRQGYQVLAFTCHNVIIFSDELKKYAESKRILLIPGIEKTIEKKHVLILNASIEAQNINSFEQLGEYKKNNPECFIVAPHPFYPGQISLNKDLINNIKLFDAIEFSWFHTKKFNQYNKKAVQLAEKYNLPVISTSDNHIFRYFDSSFTLIQAKKDVKDIFSAIRQKKTKIISHDLKWWDYFIFIPFEMGFRLFIKYFTLK